MKWEGKAIFGSSMIVFQGRSVANALHAMPATVLAISHDDTPVILGADGEAIGGPVCLVRPMTPHMVAPRKPLTIAFLSPAKWSLIDVAIEREDGGFVELACSTFKGVADMELGDIPNWLAKNFRSHPSRLHPRLEQVLQLLARSPGSLSIDNAARAAGLSTSRLRAIAKRELGVPVSSWLLWKKLEHAATSVAQGDALAQSAVSGGFVDQAHFANVMRRLLGTAPSEIALVRKLDQSR